MTKTIRFAVLILGSLLIAANAQAADTYKLDPNHTAIVWKINHFGFSSPSGKFMNVDGTLVLDDQNVANSKLNVTIPLATVDSGVPKLDEHLKTDAFFDVAKYPNAVYTSDKIEVTGTDTAIVHGNLTLHGVMKPVDLNVKLNKIGMNMMNKKTAGFTAATTIKRSDFGITTYSPNLGEEVAIEIESEANMVDPAAK